MTPAEENFLFLMKLSGEERWHRARNTFSKVFKERDERPSWFPWAADDPDGYWSVKAYQAELATRDDPDFFGVIESAFAALAEERPELQEYYDRAAEAAAQRRN